MVKLAWEVIEQISDELGPMGHGCNYSGHPIVANAGLANLEILEWENLTENVRDRRVSPQQFHLEFYNHPLVGEVHEVCLMGVLEFAADKTIK